VEGGRSEGLVEGGSSEEFVEGGRSEGFTGLVEGSREKEDSDEEADTFTFSSGRIRCGNLRARSLLGRTEESRRSTAAESSEGGEEGRGPYSAKTASSRASFVSCSSSPGVT